MAFLGQDDKQQNGQDPNQASQAGQGASGGANNPLVNSGGAVVGSGAPSTAGIGAGGTNGWTNVNAYLSANQGNTGSSDALNKQVGGAFTQEQQNLDKASQDTKSQAQAQVDNNYLGHDQASQLIQQAGNAYQYPTVSSGTDSTVRGPSRSYDDVRFGRGSNPPPTQSTGPQAPAGNYNAILGQLRSKLGAQYQGPDSFTYGMGSTAQDYGSAMQSQPGFQGLMGMIENQAAGGQMTGGQMALQNQLDTANPGLQSARQSLLSQYAGLQGNIGKTTADTNAAIGNARNQVGTNAGDLRGYIGGLQNGFKGDIDNAAAQWNLADNPASEQALAQENAAMQAHIDSGDLARYLNQRPDAQYANDYAAIFGGGKQGAGYFNTDKDSDLYSRNFITPGQTATEATAAGVDNQRNQFNAIADLLGGSKIDRGNAVTQHSAFDRDTFENQIQRGIGTWQDHRPILQ